MKALRRTPASLAMCLAAMDASAQARPVVQFIAKGGTIAVKVDPATQGVVPAISEDDLMQTVPDAGKYATIEVNSFSNMPANYLDLKGASWHFALDGCSAAEAVLEPMLAYYRSRLRIQPVVRERSRIRSTAVAHTTKPYDARRIRRGA